jgi:hypothetical protein
MPAIRASPTPLADQNHPRPDLSRRGLILSDSRMGAPGNVQQLVSQRIETLRRTGAEKAGAKGLLDSVQQLREATTDAERVADEAVERASTMTGELGSSPPLGKGPFSRQVRMLPDS